MRTYIPAPPESLMSFSLGPFTVHTYALCILAGIFFAIWYTTRRWVERGGDGEVVGSIAFWAVPFGIIGGRIYHLITSPQAYFGEGGDPISALYIWNGGLGIWGAIALGALGAYIGCRRNKVSFSTFMDAAAPGVLVAQAIGRLGNYFNQELFGGPSDAPWALWVDPQYRPAGFEEYDTFQPTFLYEMLWSLIGAVALVYIDKRFDLRGGRVFWLYVMIYTSGRLWIETLRIDDANHILGFRVNTLVSAAVLAASTIIFIWLGVRQKRLATHVPRNQLAAPHAHGGDPSASAEQGDPPVASGDAPTDGRIDA